MKIYVYYNNQNNTTFCHSIEQLTQSHNLVQVIECEETLAPITSFVDPILIGIGEVFQCNELNSNLIRIA